MLAFAIGYTLGAALEPPPRVVAEEVVAPAALRRRRGRRAASRPSAARSRPVLRPTRPRRRRFAARARRVGHRQPARESLAEVDGSLAVYLRAPARGAGRRRPGRTRSRRSAAARAERSTRDRRVRRRRRSRSRGAARGAGRARRASSRTPTALARAESRTSAQHRDAALLELVVAPDAREPQEHIREHRVAARRRMVVELLLARDQLLAVDRRLEEAATLVVGEELDRERGEAVRLAQPARVAGRDVQLESGRSRRRRSPRGSPFPSRRRRARSGGGGRPHVESGRAGTRPARPPRRRVPPARASASISPFHDAIALSSRSGFGRCSRSSKRRARVSSSSSPRITKRPCSKGCRSSSGAPSPGAHVNVSPSTPSVSASWADAKPPPSSASSRST